MHLSYAHRLARAWRADFNSYPAALGEAMAHIVKIRPLLREDHVARFEPQADTEATPEPAPAPRRRRAILRRPEPAPEPHEFYGPPSRQRWREVTGLP